MKKIIKFFGVLLMVVSLFSAAVKPVNAETILWDDAVQIKTGTHKISIKGWIDGSDVRYRYYFKATANEATITLNNKTIENSIKIDIYDQKLNWLTSVSAREKNWDNKTFKTNKGQTYYIQVSGYNYCDYLGDATFVLAQPVNNSTLLWDNAKQIKAGSQKISIKEWTDGSDVRYRYYFKATTNEVELTLNNKTIEKDIKIDIYDQKLNWLTSISAREKNWDNKTFKTNKGQTYYIQVSGYNYCDYLGDATFKLLMPGWKKNSTGWWYDLGDGSCPKNKWEKIKDDWYHFDKQGYMQTGWLKVSGKWYFLDKSNGYMKTGWVKDGGKWYYMKSSGVMATGWQKDGYKYYYMNSSGVMQKSKWIGNYYVQADGSMATNKWIGNYYVGSDGKWDKSRKK